MEKERLTIQDLFPTAQELFQAPPHTRRRRVQFVVWLALIASAVLVGRRLWTWVVRQG